MPDSASGRPGWPERAADPAIVAGITAVTALVSQRWTLLNLDGMFYSSLSLFGHEVTDRAVIPSYYSTRLGVIVPLRLLTSVGGTWIGFEAYRLIVIAAVTAGLFVIARRFAGRIAAAWITGALVLSTVLLSYAGNAYPTGSVLAATTIVMAAALSRGWRSHLVAGLAFGWLAMLHPAGLLLAASVWLAMRIHGRLSLRGILVTAGAALASFTALLIAGRVVFPGVDWFETYLTWNAKLRYSDFASADPIWLHDISLLVPAMVLVLAVGTWVLNRDQRWAQLAMIVSLTSIGFMLVINPVLGGVMLEAPMYQAMLWGPTLGSAAMLASGRLGMAPMRAAQVAAMAATILLVIVAGHATATLSLAVGALLALLCTALVLVAMALWPRLTVGRAVVALVLAVGLALSATQVLQNSRGTLGLYPHTTYANAFVPNTTSAKMHAAVNAETWLLANTAPTDQILNWVDGDWVGGDRELYMVAAMQLWGENRVTLEPVVNPDDAARLATLRPSVVQMVGPSMDGILRFWSSLPAATHPTAPQCYDFAWPTPGIPVGHSCLTRLTWPAP